MTRIKICGIKTLEDALACADADMLGFNFYPKSPRYIAPNDARTITDELRQRDRCPQLIALFVNANPNLMLDMVEIAGMDAIQLSGDETPEIIADLDFPVYKAIRPRAQAEAETLASSYLPHAPEDIDLPALLVDAYHKELYGGTGEQASLDIALAVKRLAPRMMLAGGLTPDNITDRVQAIQPWGVDVASGVETDQPGIKDHAKVRAFIDAVRQKEQQL